MKYSLSLIVLAALFASTNEKVEALMLNKKNSEELVQLSENTEETTETEQQPVQLVQKKHKKKGKKNKDKKKKKSQLKGGDKYKQANEYEEDFKEEERRGGYNVGPVENFGARENEELPTPLDGETLTKEIGGTSLTAELNDAENGAGIKDKEDLADLLASIKGAQTFMNKTPKEQL